MVALLFKFGECLESIGSVEVQLGAYFAQLGLFLRLGLGQSATEKNKQLRFVVT